MGNSSKSHSESYSVEYEFEVIEVEFRSSPRSSPRNLCKVWTSRTFRYTHNLILVSSGENDPEEILIDSHFQIINEQPEDLIFTIQFHSQKSETIHTWKIKSKDQHDFKHWKKSLRGLLQIKWKNSDNCENCGRHFGVFLRKHHCRKCGKCICEKCSPFRSTLPELTYKDLVRICIDCSKGVCERRKGGRDVDIPNFQEIKSKRMG